MEPTSFTSSGEALRSILNSQHAFEVLRHEIFAFERIATEVIASKERIAKLVIEARERALLLEGVLEDDDTEVIPPPDLLGELTKIAIPYLAEILVSASRPRPTTGEEAPRADHG